MLLEVDTGSRRQRQPSETNNKLIRSTEPLFVKEDMNNGATRTARPDLIVSRSNTTNNSKPVLHPLLPPELRGVTPIKDPDINENDVLCGRGGDINSHVGNEQFRKLVEQKKNIYLTARFKREKRIIAASVVEEIHRMNPPGRFLSKIQVPGKRRGRRNKGPDLGWYVIEDDKAREKASQALRENAPALRKELKQKQQESERSLAEDDEIIDEDIEDSATAMDTDLDEERNSSTQKPRPDFDSSSRSSPSDSSFSGYQESSDSFPKQSQAPAQQQWKPPKAPPSQALVPRHPGQYENDSSFMWNSIKSAAAAATNMVSSCVNGNADDDLLALTAPDESRMVLGNERNQRSNQGTIGGMAAAASAAATSMVNACWGVDEGEPQIEPLALPAPSPRPRDPRQRDRPRKFDIRRGSFENHTNRRRMRAPVDHAGNASSAPFSPIRVAHGGFDANEAHNEFSLGHNAHAPPNQAPYVDHNQQKRQLESQAPAPTLDFEFWMQHADHNGNINVEQVQPEPCFDHFGHQVNQPNQMLFHPGHGGPDERQSRNPAPAFPEPPLCRQERPVVHTPNNYGMPVQFSSNFKNNMEPIHQPYLTEKTATDSWLGPIASKSSEFSDMDMQLQGLLDLSFDSPDNNGGRQPSWEQHPRGRGQRDAVDYNMLD